MSREFESFIDGAVLFITGFAFAKIMSIHTYNTTTTLPLLALGILFTVILIDFFGFAGGLLLGTTTSGLWPLYFAAGILLYQAFKEIVRHRQEKQVKKSVVS